MMNELRVGELGVFGQLIHLLLCRLNRVSHQSLFRSDSSPDVGAEQVVPLSFPSNAPVERTPSEACPKEGG